MRKQKECCDFSDGILVLFSIYYKKEHLSKERPGRTHAARDIKPLRLILVPMAIMILFVLSRRISRAAFICRHRKPSAAARQR